MVRIANLLAGRDSYSLHLDGLGVRWLVATMAVDDYRPLHGQPGRQVRNARPNLEKSPPLSPRVRGRVPIPRLEGLSSQVSTAPLRLS